MQKLAYIFLFIVVLACNSPKQGKEAIGTGKLIPINFSDSKYAAIIHYAEDTITPSGWQIRYLVKDDSTRYSDLYIEWSKDGIINTYKCEKTLENKSYFVPEYIGESDRFIFLIHFSSASTRAILNLGKIPPYRSGELDYLVDYDKQNNQFFSITKETYKSDGYFDVSIDDMDREEIFTMRIYGFAPLRKENAIDYVSFSKNEVAFGISIRKTDKDSVITKEEHSIDLTHGKK